MRRQWLVRHSFRKIMSIDCSTSACCLLTWIQSPVRRQAVEIPVCKSCLTKWSHLGLSTKCRSSNWDAPEGMNDGNFAPWTTSFQSLWDHPSWELSISILWSLCSLLRHCPLLQVPGSASWMIHSGWVWLKIWRAHSCNRTPLCQGGVPFQEWARRSLKCHWLAQACGNWAAQNVTGESTATKKGKIRPFRQGKAEAIEFT